MGEWWNWACGLNAIAISVVVRFFLPFGVIVVQKPSRQRRICHHDGTLAGLNKCSAVVVEIDRDGCPALR
jgi:hypothetical protein